MIEDLLIAVSVDVECDKDECWDVRRPLAFRGVEEGIGRCLTPLFRQYGVRPTYLVSPEVLRDRGSVTLLRGIEGCELGAHLHPEFVSAGETVTATSAVACQLPEENERRDLEELTLAFERALGVRPVSYRAGRYGASARSVRMLVELGYLVDTSVTPHKLWDYGLDFRGAPDSPYFPALDDITKPGLPGGLLEVPISLRPSPAPVFVRRTAEIAARSRLRVARDFAKWARGPAWFRPGWSSRVMLLRFVREAACGEYGRVLNMMFHNVDVVAGCSPNAVSEVSVQAALDDMRAVFEEALSHGMRFATLLEVREAVAGSWTTR